MQLRRYLSGITALAVATAVLITGPFPAAQADEPLPLGPTVIKTDAPPTGYAVTFRYQAPLTALTVHILGDWWYATPPGSSPNHPPSEWQPGDFAATPWRIQAMTQGEDGVWEITIPLPNGSFRYVFTHNCLSDTASNCNLNEDPANPWQIRQQDQYPAPAAVVGATRSTIYVPSNPLFPTYDNGYQAPTSPDESGTLESVNYPAPESLNPPGSHWMVVYTPAGYDPNRATPYPLLIVSHGFGDSSPAWMMQGVAHYIVENAIQEGAVQPMVVVSTDFNGLPGGNQGYADHLRNTVIPYLEANYNISTLGADRAFGGFSMGGSRAITILTNNTDLFGNHAIWSITVSGSTPSETQLQNILTVPGAIHLGCGFQDGTTSGCASSLENFATRLRNGGVKNVFVFNMDGMHTWHVWRPLLDHYIRNLAFRTTTPLADLVVADITTASKVGAGDNAVITATIANQGDAEAAATDTFFELDGSELGNVDTPAIAAGESVEVQLNWNTAGVKGEHVIRVTADVSALAEESDEDNNAATLTVNVRGNKVTNGSFEQANSAGDGPEGWTASDTAAGEASWSEDGTANEDGEPSMAAVFTGSGGSAALAGSPTWTSAPIAVAPGEVLELVASVDVRGASSAPSVGLAYLGPLGQVLDAVKVLAAPLSTGGFQELSATVTIPDGVAEVRVVLSGFAPTDLRTAGTVVFDDVGLFER